MKNAHNHKQLVFILIAFASRICFGFQRRVYEFCKHQALSVCVAVCCVLVPVPCAYSVQFGISHCVLNVWITAAKNELHFDYNIISLNPNGSHAAINELKAKWNETETYNLHWPLDNGSRLE